MFGLELALEPERQVRRIEVTTGAGGRRRWTVDGKAWILAETLEPGAAVAVVGRRHGLTPQQLFDWRRKARKRSEASDYGGRSSFVPAVTELPSVPGRRRQQAAAIAAIKLEMGGVRVRIGSGAKASIVSALIRALKETS